MKPWTILTQIINTKYCFLSFLSVIGYILCNYFSLLLPLMYREILSHAIERKLLIDIGVTWILLGIIQILVEKFFLRKNAKYKLAFQNSLIQNTYKWFINHLDTDRSQYGSSYYKNFFIQNIERIVALVDLNNLSSLLNTLSFFAITFIILKIDFFAGIITVIFGIFAIVFHKIGNSHYMKHGMETQVLAFNFLSDQQDTLNGSRIIHNFQACKKEVLRNQQKLELLSKKENKNELFRFMNFFVGLDLCKTTYLLFIIGYALYLVQISKITLATASVLIMYSNKTTNPIQYLNYALTQLQEGITAIRILCIELSKPHIRSVPSINQEIQKSIECKDVSFSYGDTNILNNFCFTFHVGKKYYINGPSGCGKTTLLCLLAQILEPNSGEILYDNQLPYGKPYISFHSQNTFIFQGSIWENISFSLEYDNRVQELISIMELQYLDMSNIDPDLLSGGEKSRILLARTLWNAKKIIILDEPLIGVDDFQKKRILSSISPWLEGKLVIFSSHDKELAQYFSYDYCINL